MLWMRPNQGSQSRGVALLTGTAHGSNSPGGASNSGEDPKQIHEAIQVRNFRSICDWDISCSAQVSNSCTCTKPLNFSYIVTWYLITNSSHKLVKWDVVHTFNDVCSYHGSNKLLHTRINHPVAMPPVYIWATDASQAPLSSLFTADFLGVINQCSPGACVWPICAPPCSVPSQRRRRSWVTSRPH